MSANIYKLMSKTSNYGYIRVINVSFEEVYSRHIFSRFDQKLIEFIINAANFDLPLRLFLLKVKVLTQKWAYHEFVF